MKHFTFKREARWLMWVAVVLPALAILLTFVWPVVARWLWSR